MSLLRKLSSVLFGARDKPAEQAVIVHFNYIGTTDLGPLQKLEQQLEAVLSGTSVGEYDGNEVATDGSDGYLYLYGHDAALLYSVIRPHLEACSFMRKAKVKLRYGPPIDGVREEFLELGA